MRSDIIINTKSFSRHAFIGLGIFISPLIARAQSNVWTQSNGPYGGFVNSLTVNGSEVFAGTRYGVYSTSDQGTHWTPTFPAFSTEDITDIAVAHDGTILVDAEGASEIFVSTNGGSSFQAGTGLTNAYPQQLMIGRSGNYFAVAVNVYKSTDRGASWHESGGPPAPVPEAMCQDSSGVIYSANNGKIFASMDDGETWAQQKPGLTTAGYCNSLQANASGNLFVATDSVTYRSTDQGKDWTPLTVGMPRYPVLYISSQPGILYAVGYWGFYRSTSDGNTWTSSTTDLNPTAILPLGNSNVLIATYGGIYRTTDNGTNWREEVNGITNTFIGPIVAKSSGDVFAAATGVAAGVFHSSDNGGSWAEANLRSATYNPVSSLGLLHSGSVLAATRGSGLYRTSNNAANWQRVGSDIPDSNFQCLAVSQTDELLLGTQNQGTFLSTDQGNNWIDVTKSISDSAIRAAAFDSLGNFIIATQQEIYLSSDQGAHWTNLSGSLSGYVGILAVSKSGSIFLYEYSGGLFQGSTTGGSWQNKTAGLPNSPVTSITLFGDTLYVTTDSGIYRSTNDGSNWTSTNVGLTGVFTNINSFALSPDGYFFAGTYGDGVFRSGALLAGVSDRVSSDDGIFAYPNPCSDHIHLQFPFENASDLTLTAINALGESVANEHFITTGHMGMDFKTSTLASGVYRFVLHSSFGETSQMVVVAH